MPSYKKNLLLQIGPIQTAVNLYTVKQPSQKSGVRRVCPEHMVPLKQQYACYEGDDTEIFHWGEWADAVETPEGWRKVKQSERPEVDASESLTLIPVPAEEVNDHTFEGDNIYYCQPAGEAYHLTWEILNRQMKSGKTVFLARGALRRGREKLWKLELFRGYPVLREIMFPEGIKDTPETDVDVTVDRETQKLVSTFVDQAMKSWDEIDTDDEFQKRFDKWIDSGELVQVNDKESPSTKQTPQEMIAGLQEAVRNATKNQ